MDAELITVAMAASLFVLIGLGTWLVNTKLDAIAHNVESLRKEFE